MHLRPRAGGLVAASLLSAAALVALALPAGAAPAAGSGRPAAKPIAVDGSQHTRAATRRAAAEARHRVPNPLLKELLSEDEEESGD